MIKDLKPCPFCGSTDLVIGKGGSYIECLNCETLGPSAVSSVGVNWSQRVYEEEAMVAWNRRTRNEKPSSPAQSIDQPLDYPARPQEGGAEGRDAQAEAQALEECIYQRLMLALGLSSDGGAGK